MKVLAPLDPIESAVIPPEPGFVANVAATAMNPFGGMISGEAHGAPPDGVGTTLTVFVPERFFTMKFQMVAAGRVTGVGAPLVARKLGSYHVVLT